MTHHGATTPRRLEHARPRAKPRSFILVARAPWPEAETPAQERRWPRALGLLLAIVVSAALWGLLIWGVCLLLR
jgi:hypothetical protein